MKEQLEQLIKELKHERDVRVIFSTDAMETARKTGLDAAINRLQTLVLFA